MVLHLKSLHVARSALPLPLHVVAQLRRGHLLRLLGGDEQLVRNDRQRDILPLTAFQRLAHACEGAFGIVLQVPVFQGVVVDPVRRRTGHQRLAVKLLDGAAVAHVVVLPERLDIEDRAWLHLQLHVTRVLGGEMLDVLVREMQHSFAASGYDPSSQDHAQRKKKRRREGVRDHQTVVTHPRGMHRDDLRVARHLRGEINDGNEDEQRTEHVHVVGDEGDVVVEDDLPEWHLFLEEIVHLLRQVEDDGDGQDQHDREKERPEKFLNYVPIKSLHSVSRNFDISVSRYLGSHPLHEIRHHAGFPAAEIACQDMLPGLRHEVQVER